MSAFKDICSFHLLIKLNFHRSKTSGSGAPAPPLDSVNIEELVTKGLRRINVLIEKTVDLKSSSDLEKRMEDINVSLHGHHANLNCKLPVQTTIKSLSFNRRN